MRKNQHEDKILRIGIGIGFLVVVIWALFWIGLVDDQNRGTFGDMFGAANALFSGLAFAGVVVAILLQRLEMQESRSEFIKAAQDQREFYAEERRANTQEATDALFKEWWSKDMSAARAYFFDEFVAKEWANLVSTRKGLKSVSGHDVHRLTGFFDRVGWLGAAGLTPVPT